MSAILTWHSSGLGTKTGTTNQALLDDLDTLISSKSGDANFKWEKASKNSSGASPLYLVLRRKDAAAGRILLVIWTSAPAGNNVAILDQAPTTNTLYCAFFPAGNVDAPSNLTASSGTVMGNDTGAVKVGAGTAIANYGAGVQPYYFDADEAVMFALQSVANSFAYVQGAGALLVDAADNAYPAVLSTGAVGFTGVGTNVFSWVSTVAAAGGGTTCIRTNYGSANRAYYSAWAPSGAWANQAVGPTDILTDTSGALAWFVPIRLLGQAKGEGLQIKLRQIAFGPGTTGPLTVYNSATLTPAARQLNAATAGTPGYPWLTNFKL